MSRYPVLPEKINKVNCLLLLGILGLENLVCMFRKGMYLSLFYFLCYEMHVYIDMSEDQISEERYPQLNEEEDIRMDEIR